MSGIRENSYRSRPTAAGARSWLGMATALMLVAGACTSDDPPKTATTTSLDQTITATKSALAALATASDPAGASITVDIDAPDDATEMQIGTDATFLADDWRPVAATAEVTLPNAGYQTIFARFRGDDGAVSATAVLGVTSDPTREAALSDPRVPAAIGLAAPDIVQVTVENGRVEFGGIDGEDRIVGAIDGLVELDQRTWTVTSTDDPAFSGGVAATAVHRVTQANGSAGADGDTVFATIHEFFLVLPGPLTSGRTYEVKVDDPVLEPATFTFDAATTESRSVHVNQVGLGPNDPVKRAHLSAWMGDGGGVEFGSAPAFTVRTLAGDEVFRGVGSLRAIPPDGELGRGDLTGSPVWELDFSSVTTEGEFRVCVDAVGCSSVLRISPDAWRSVTVAVARSMYHQRSGTALEAPFTSVQRPEVRGPKSVKVRQSTYTLLEANATSGDKGFQELEDGATDTIVEGAWGGHFDAGDWDRRIQHLTYVRDAIDLLETSPELYANLDLGIPESGDAIPDLLDEALWSLDLYRRLQRDDGAVSGGIESTGHPADGSTSWTDELPLYAFAPDPWATYIYAATAAEMAGALETYDPERAADFQSSALRAMEWADGADYDRTYDDVVAAQKSVAAAALYRLTGEDRWQEAFAASSPLGDGVVENLGCHEHGACDAAWIFARTEWPNVDQTLRSNVVASFRSTAENLVAEAATTTYGWAPEHPEVPLVWGLGLGGAPRVIGLLRAYLVTEDPSYLVTAFGAASVSLGDNPADKVFITGFGRRPVRDPLIVDNLYGGLPVWPGTPVFGNHVLAEEQRWVQNFFLEPSGVTPGGYDRPYLWSHHDFHQLPPMSEYTVFQSQGPSIFAYGLLAGESFQ